MNAILNPAGQPTPDTPAGSTDSASSTTPPAGVNLPAASNDAAASSGDAAGSAGSADASGSASQAAGGSSQSSTKSPEALVADIDAELQEKIRKMTADADRRKAQVIKTVIPLPQRKTTAFDFLEKERDRVRQTLAQPLMLDADVDAHIKVVLDAWHVSQQPAQ